MRLPADLGTRCDVLDPRVNEHPGCEDFDFDPMREMVRSARPRVGLVWWFVDELPQTQLLVSTDGSGRIRSTEDIAEFVRGATEGFNTNPDLVAGSITWRAAMIQGLDDEIPMVRVLATLGCPAGDSVCSPTQVVSTGYLGDRTNVFVTFIVPSSDRADVDRFLQRIDRTVDLPVEPNVRFDESRASRIGYAVGQLLASIGMLMVVPLAIYFDRKKKKRAAAAQTNDTQS
jgi:hypothetical protein